MGPSARRMAGARAVYAKENGVGLLAVGGLGDEAGNLGGEVEMPR